jgi:diacylglycerol kinase (ATP)
MPLSTRPPIQAFRLTQLALVFKRHSPLVHRLAGASVDRTPVPGLRRCALEGRVRVTSRCCITRGVLCGRRVVQMDATGASVPAALVINTGSRRGADALPVARDALHRHGIEVAVAHAITDPSSLPEVVAEVVTSGAQLVVVGGGDGTMRCAAGVLADASGPRRAVLGVLPLGTANDFARSLDIPKGIEAASQVLATGKIVDVDVGRANAAPFLNVASMGLSVRVTYALKPGLKRRLGPVAYPFAALTAFQDHRPFSALLEFPAGDLDRIELDDLLQVGVGNGRHYGGGATVAPNASVDDHLLDVFAIARGRLRDHISIASLLRSGRLVEHEKVWHFATSEVVVNTDGEQPVSLDGEIATTTPSRFCVQPNAIDVFVPQHLTDARRERHAP